MNVKLVALKILFKASPFKLFKILIGNFCMQDYFYSRTSTITSAKISRSPQAFNSAWKLCVKMNKTVIRVNTLLAKSQEKQIIRLSQAIVMQLHNLMRMRYFIARVKCIINRLVGLASGEHLPHFA